jgi:hypothetical protein
MNKKVVYLGIFVFLVVFICLLFVFRNNEAESGKVNSFNVKQNRIDSSELFSEPLINNEVKRSCFELDTLIDLVSGKLVDSIYIDCTFTHIDSLYESEGYSWPIRKYYFNDTLMFIVETNWENKEKVQRLIVYSDKITNSYKRASVGKTFIEVNAEFSQNIPVYPDGCFVLRDSDNSSISYFFNIDNYPNLISVVPTWREIPDNLEIEYFIVDLTKR